jgi:hypothetical protein
MQRSFHSLGPMALCLTSVVLTVVACGDDEDGVSGCLTDCGGAGGSSNGGGGSGGKANGGSQSEGGVVGKAGTGGTPTGGTAGATTGGTAGATTGGTAGATTGGTAGTGGTPTGGTSSDAGAGGQPMTDAGAGGQPMSDAGAGGQGGDPGGPTGPTIIGDIILKYDFSENAGTIAVDSTDNNLDGTITDGTWVAGRNGAGASLAAATSLVTLPAGIVSSATEFTAATWVYLTANDGWARIFDFGDGAENYMFLTANANGAGTRFAMRVNGGVEEVVNVPAMVPLNVWKHIAVTVSATGARLYVDGHQVAHNAAFAGKPADLGVTQQNWIGKSQFPDAPYKGQLDEFYLYKKALTEKEIQQLAWPKTDYSVYHFDETTGTTAADSSDNAKDATLVGPTFSAGRMGNALTMGATGESYATLPTGIVSGCSDMTVAAWINMTANDTWNRVFDFGLDNTAYVFLTPRKWNDNMVFAIKPSAADPEQLVEAPAAFTLNTWYHVAAVMDGTTARIYLSGNQIGAATFTTTPAAVGATTLNYFGKSQWPDPNFRGLMDEIIISCRAFTADEIKMLAQ